MRSLAEIADKGEEAPKPYCQQRAAIEKRHGNDDGTLQHFHRLHGDRTEPPDNTPFEHRFLPAVCGNRYEKIAEACFNAGYQTVAQYRRARAEGKIEAGLIQYVCGCDKRLSFVGQCGLNGLDAHLAQKEAEFLKSSA